MTSSLAISNASADQASPPGSGRKFGSVPDGPSQSGPDIVFLLPMDFKQPGDFLYLPMGLFNKIIHLDMLDKPPTIQVIFHKSPGKGFSGGRRNTPPPGWPGTASCPAVGRLARVSNHFGKMVILYRFIEKIRKTPLLDQHPPNSIWVKPRICFSAS